MPRKDKQLKILQNKTQKIRHQLSDMSRRLDFQALDQETREYLYNAIDKLRAFQDNAFISYGNKS